MRLKETKESTVSFNIFLNIFKNYMFLILLINSVLVSLV